MKSVCGKLLAIGVLAVMLLSAVPFAASAYVMGDVNEDGEITLADVSYIRARIGSVDADDIFRCDLNFDGEITLADYSMSLSTVGRRNIVILM